MTTIKDWTMAFVPVNNSKDYERHTFDVMCDDPVGVIEHLAWLSKNELALVRWEATSEDASYDEDLLNDWDDDVKSYYTHSEYKEVLTGYANIIGKTNIGTGKWLRGRWAILIRMSIEDVKSCMAEAKLKYKKLPGYIVSRALGNNVGISSYISESKNRYVVTKQHGEWDDDSDDTFYDSYSEYMEEFWDEDKNELIEIPVVYDTIKEAQEQCKNSSETVITEYEYIKQCINQL